MTVHSPLYLEHISSASPEQRIVHLQCTNMTELAKYRVMRVLYFIYSARHPPFAHQRLLPLSSPFEALT